jgi:hypothetical protein
MGWMPEKGGTNILKAFKLPLPCVIGLRRERELSSFSMQGMDNGSVHLFTVQID